ncbi:hypothetical protein SYNPS1DRAFT_24182 [Syncephalis pseudoplumigaleata]|uniref:Uncharacterized protein n=1 Tax=Syncephalis pseudoplumigaleata TaxID=1712513 RepID=A0A4P9YUN4_9FUNG|nr:hypothetical protein SYNPS1DRAFT_24182 [Syncephalis pseudoplumigaleata]|eukprot:RKP23743.1 hypothetical protein SYNPS1DRAFT_24182 [Syncephalis pseudoplumigaleata]
MASMYIPIVCRIVYCDTRLILLFNGRTRQLTLAHYVYYVGPDRLLKLRPYLKVQRPRYADNIWSDIHHHSLCRSDQYFVGKSRSDAHLFALPIKRGRPYIIRPHNAQRIADHAGDRSTLHARKHPASGQRFSAMGVWCLQKAECTSHPGYYEHAFYHLHQRQWYPTGPTTSSTSDDAILEANGRAATCAVADVDMPAGQLIVQRWQSTTDHVATRCTYDKRLVLPDSMAASEIGHVMLGKVDMARFIVTASTSDNLFAALIEPSADTATSSDDAGDGGIAMPRWSLLLDGAFETEGHYVSGRRFYVVDGQQRRYRIYDIATGDCIYDARMAGERHWRLHVHLFDDAYAVLVGEQGDTPHADEHHPYSHRVLWKDSAHLRRWLLCRLSSPAITMQLPNVPPDQPCSPLHNIYDCRGSAHFFIFVAFMLAAVSVVLVAALYVFWRRWQGGIFAGLYRHVDGYRIPNPIDAFLVCIMAGIFEALRMFVPTTAPLFWISSAFFLQLVLCNLALSAWLGWARDHGLLQAVVAATKAVALSIAASITIMVLVNGYYCLGFYRILRTHVDLIDGSRRYINSQRSVARRYRNIFLAVTLLLLLGTFLGLAFGMILQQIHQSLALSVALSMLPYAVVEPTLMLAIVYNIWQTSRVQIQRNWKGTHMLADDVRQHATGQTIASGMTLTLAWQTFMTHDEGATHSATDSRMSSTHGE